MKTEWMKSQLKDLQESVLLHVYALERCAYSMIVDPVDEDRDAYCLELEYYAIEKAIKDKFAGFRFDVGDDDEDCRNEGVEMEVVVREE